METGTNVIPHTRRATRFGQEILVYHDTPAARLEQLRRSFPSATAEIERLVNAPVPASFLIDPGKKPPKSDAEGQLRLV